jgi:hypothetical protein
VNKNQPKIRRSITNKEDIYTHLNFTPDIKNNYLVTKKKSVFLDSKQAKFHSTNINTKLDKDNLAQRTSKDSVNMKKSTNHALLNSNCILTTNYSENNKDVKEEEHIITMSTNNTPKNNIDDCQSDILSTIQNFGKIIKTQTTTINGTDVNKINNLNSMLHNIVINSDNKNNDNNNQNHLNNSHLFTYMNDSKNLLMENNVIRRDTFIDNNFNTKLRVDKDEILNEIYTNSDMRMKKYGILFDFINNNIKEITEMVSNQNTTNKNIDDDNIIEMSSDVKNRNIIDINSNTPIKRDNVNRNKKYPAKMLTDISNSFIESSAEEEFYRDLVDHTINYNLDNFSNEMSSLRSRIDISNFNDKMDQTQFQYDDMTPKNRKSPIKDLDNNETCHVVETELEFKREPSFNK